MKFSAAFVLILYLVNAQRFSDQFKQVRFESHNFYYLNITRLGVTFVVDQLDCSFACLQNILCVSFNLAVFADEKRKLWCELLPSSIYNNAAKLVSDDQYRHYSVQNPCDNALCMNNGMCSPISFRDGTYQCTCHPGYLGDECEIDAPECRDYAVLSEPNRHPSYGRGDKADGSLVPGWYRFHSSSYTRMIDSCIPPHKCLTGLTGWLNGGEPAFEDGIVAREACFHGYNNCCYMRVQIRVRECQGFYVYELQPPPAGKFRYCANA